MNKMVSELLKDLFRRSAVSQHAFVKLRIGSVFLYDYLKWFIDFYNHTEVANGMFIWTLENEVKPRLEAYGKALDDALDVEEKSKEYDCMLCREIKNVRKMIQIVGKITDEENKFQEGK